MNRTEMLKRMSAQPWDLLVIGGGISGAGLVREAALRGLNAALVEQDDFASGTSSRSGKMIVGGLRYLLNREVHLVRKGLRERDHLLRMAPHLVWRAPYLFPVWEGDPDPLWKVRLGLTLYDLLGGARSEWRHRAFDSAGLLGLEPGLRADGLRGGAEYSDGMTDDARLTLETLQSAVGSGAPIANYAKVEGFLKHHGKIIGVRARDVLENADFDIQARLVVTAAGPWTDHLRRLDDPSIEPLLRLVKGTFIVVPRDRLPVERNVTFRARDQRMTFAVPIRQQTYIGTTESDYLGNPSLVAPDRLEVDYLLEAANRAFPEAGLREEDVISAWSGLRPLVGSRPGQNPSRVTRDYKIVRHKSGLVVLAGGKLTGFRGMAESVINHLFPRTRWSNRSNSLEPLPGAAGPLPTAAFIARLAAQTGVSQDGLGEEIGRYGSQINDLASEVFRGGTDGPKAWLLAQTRHAVKYEMAQRLSDVLWRRTGTMIFQSGNGLDVALDVGQQMARLLGWPPHRLVQELRDYGREVSRMWEWKDQSSASRGGASTSSLGEAVAGRP